MDRAYSILTVKSLDEATRVITGVASTPSVDRQEDVVEPLGAEFELPLPFLLHHDSKSPVGLVTMAKPGKDGIPVRIELKQTDEPGLVRDRLESAWQDIKLGLIRGLSIGFKSLESEPIKGSFGMRFKRWRWLELSAVTVPANADATIALIKSIDTEILAATGEPHRKPGASGVKLIKQPKPRGGQMNITEQIKDFEATRAAKAARRTEIQTKAGTESRSKNEAEREEFDTLTSEIKSIDQELVDLRALEKENVEQAKAVSVTPTVQAASESRGTQVTVKSEEKLAPGIEFARYAMCLAGARGDLPRALELAKTHYPRQERAHLVLKHLIGVGSNGDLLGTRTKADVAAGTTVGTTWALPLLAYNDFAGDFVEFLRPQTIIGQFGRNGVPDLRRIPFNVHIKGQTSGGTGYWVGEGAPKPVTAFDFNNVYHGFYKVAAISVITEELIRFSDPSAEMLVRDGLAGALIARLDTDFIDPDKAVSANVSPASITNGVTPTHSTATDGDGVRSELQTLWATPLAANLPLMSAVYITTPQIALGLSLMMNALGQPEFPGMTMLGGRLLGVPVIVSNYVPGGRFILAFASEIYLSDDGGVTVDASREASIEMLNNPTNNSATPTATAMVSMYQTDSVALRAHRFMNWSKRRTTAVAFLDSVEWGGAVAES